MGQERKERGQTVAILFCCKSEWRPCDHLTAPSASNTATHSLSCVGCLADCRRHDGQYYWNITCVIYVVFEWLDLGLPAGFLPFLSGNQSRALKFLCFVSSLHALAGCLPDWWRLWADGVQDPALSGPPGQPIRLPLSAWLTDWTCWLADRLTCFLAGRVVSQ